MRRVAITVKGGADLDAAVDPQFGRSERFLVVDADSGELLESRDNAAAADAHGAGIGAARLVAGMEAGAVLSGRFGPKAYEALKALDIAMYPVPEGFSARQALEALREGRLTAFEVKVL